MDYIPDRYDQVDLSVQKKATKSNKAVDAVDAIIDLPFTVGLGMLIAGWKAWRSRVPFPVKMLLGAVLFPAGAFLLLLALVAG